MKTKFSVAYILCHLLLLFAASLLFAKQDGKPISDPVVLGAWLYEGKCFRCHKEYNNGRMAEEYDDKEELIQLISHDGCQISWSAREGGELNKKEIKALATFMLAWEEKGGDLDLPQLPPQPQAANGQAVSEKEKQPTIQKETAEKPDTLSAALVDLIDQNQIARGGWLYTSNCYRCHLSYQEARLGKDMTYETVFRFIFEGKTSTQMKPFSRTLGGNLKNSEIRDITEYITRWEAAGEELAIARTLMKPPSLDPDDFKPLRLGQIRKVTGNFEAGRAAFTKHCVACHAADGGGYIGPSLGLAKSPIRTDLYIKSVLKNGVANSMMVAWDRNNGGTLSAKEIDNLISFILVKKKELQR